MATCLEQNLKKSKMEQPKQENNSSNSNNNNNNSDQKKDNKVLIIMRGLPGSGKSTKAKSLCPFKPHSQEPDLSHIYSADDFFLDEKGNYVFTGKVWLAHDWNQKRVAEALANEQTPIIVDNTHTQKWEAKPYVDMGLEFGYEIRIEEPDTTWKKDVNELAKKNVHGVAADGIQRMLDKWEDDFTVENILVSERPPNKNPNNRGGHRGGFQQRGGGAAHRGKKH